MKLKDMLILLVIINLAISLYYIPSSMRSIVDMFGYSINGEYTYLFYLMGQFSHIFFSILGLVGVILFFIQNQNIYNRVLKIYLIQHSISIIFGLPSRLSWMFRDVGGILWYYHLFYMVAIAVMVLSMIVYSKQSIRVLPSPVSSKSVRFLHRFVDGIIVNLLIFSNSFMFLNLFNDNPNESMIIIGYILLLLCPFVYYVVCEAGFKQTIGKVLTGAYVRSEQGGRAGFGQILGRSLCRYIPFEAFSYLPDPMSKWHDKFSGTDVFYESNVDLEGDGAFTTDHLVSKDDYI